MRWSRMYSLAGQMSDRKLNFMPDDIWRDANPLSEDHAMASRHASNTDRGYPRTTLQHYACQLGVFLTDIFLCVTSCTYI